MPHFMIAHRLKDDATYDARRSTLVKAASIIAPLSFDEMTSLIFLQCGGSAFDLRAYLLAASELYRDGRDVLLVVETSIHAYAAVGLKQEALFNLATGTVPIAVAPPFPVTFMPGNYLPGPLDWLTKR